MGAKKSFVLRIDEDTFKAIEKWAGDEFRSVNGQLEWLLHKALKDAKRKQSTDPTAPLDDAPEENHPDAPGD